MTQVHAADACFSVMYSQKVLGSKSETHSGSGFRNVLHLINARFLAAIQAMLVYMLHHHAVVEQTAEVSLLKSCKGCASEQSFNNI